MKKFITTILLFVLMISSLAVIPVKAEDTNIAGSLKLGVNTITELGTYQFTPSSSGYYMRITKFKFVTSEGKDCYYYGSIPFSFLNESGIYSCYLEKGKTYTLDVEVQSYADQSITISNGTVEIIKATTYSSYGTIAINATRNNNKFWLLSVPKDDTYNFTSNTDGDLFLLIYSKNGLIQPTSGTNDVDADNGDYNFDKKYALTAGTYVLYIQVKTDAAGTYTITDSNHEYKTTTYSDGTYLSKCKYCGIIDETNSHTVHSFGKWSTNTATALKTGTHSRTCSICGYKETEKTSKLTPTIKLSATKKTIKKKKNYILKISNLAKGDSVSSVKSSKTSVATVKKYKTNQYKITGKKKGNATITVKLKSGKKATCKVTVK